MQLRTGPLARVLIPTRPSRQSLQQPARSRRARTSSLVGLALIIAAQIGMSAAVETVKPEWRDPEYGHRLKRLQSLVREHPNRPLVLALGSSRTQMGLSPAAMGFGDEPGSPLVFNFAQAGAGSVHMRLTLERILDAGIRPDFVLIEFYPVGLVADGPAEEVLKSWGPRLDLGDLRRLEPYCRDAGTLRREWAANRIAPWHSLRLILMSHWQPGWLPWHDQQAFLWEGMDKYGWTAFPIEPVREDMRSKWTEQAREEHQDLLADLRIGSSSDQALRDIVARCRRDKIPVALYLTPEGPVFRGWYSPHTLATVEVYSQRFIRELAVPLFDSARGFTEDEFSDSHHLLKSGAARFSRRLAEEHLGDWIRKESAAHRDDGSARR